MLGMSTLQAQTACTGVARQNCIEKAGVDASGCDPVVELLVAPVFFLDTDSCAVGPTEINCGVNQLLQDGVGFLQ